MKKIKRKLLPELLISKALVFNISATECPIKMNSVLDSADQAPQHNPKIKANTCIIIKDKDRDDLANRVRSS